MKKTAIIFSLALFAITAISCSKTTPTEETKAPEEEVEVTEEADAVSGEAIFTYNDAQNLAVMQPEITLTFQSEPVQILGLGFVKLKGVIMGASPAALLEVAGMGMVVRKGDALGGYTVEEIREDYIRMRTADVGTGLVPVRSPGQP